MNNYQARTNINHGLAFMRRNAPSEAYYVFKELVKYKKWFMVKTNLTNFILSDIGIGNVPLVNELLPVSESSLKKIIVDASRSFKCPMGMYMEMYFRKWYIEPFPPVIEFLKDMKGEFDINYLRIASSMYWSQLDDNFWDIIMCKLPLEDDLFITKLKEISDQDSYCTIQCFIMAILFKFYRDNDAEFPSRSQRSKFFEMKHLKLTSFRNYYYNRLEYSLFDQEKWKKAYVEPSIIKPKRALNWTQSSAYFYIENNKIIYGTKKPKCSPGKAKSLEDLGTLRILKVYKFLPLTILCWEGNKCYQLYQLKKTPFEDHEYGNEVIRKYVDSNAAPKSKRVNILGKFKVLKIGSIDFQYENTREEYALSVRPVIYGSLKRCFGKKQKSPLTFEAALIRHVKSIFGMYYQKKYLLVFLRKNNSFGVYSTDNCLMKNYKIINDNRMLKLYPGLFMECVEKILKDLDPKKSKNRLPIRRAKVIKYRIIRHCNFGKI